MTRKATAKSAEANAAVLSRAAGLDQRFKMSASVAGFPSIYAATACLSFLSARVGAAGEHSQRCSLQLLQNPDRCSSSHCFASMSRELYFARVASPFTLPFESLQASELFAKLASCKTLARVQLSKLVHVEVLQY